MAVQVNFLAVLVAAIASFAIATVWYGVVFRKLWMRLTGVTDMKPAPIRQSRQPAGDALPCRTSINELRRRADKIGEARLLGGHPAFCTGPPRGKAMTLFRPG